jgi:hypothetical protein
LLYLAAIPLAFVQPGIFNGLYILVASNACSCRRSETVESLFRSVHGRAT